MMMPAAALAAVLLAMNPALHAQGNSGLDSKGKEFWVTFMANFGSQGDPEVSDLHLYLACDRPTTVQITFGGDTRTVNLATANKVVDFDVTGTFGDFVELTDVLAGGGEIQPKSLHIVADDEIAVYGVNIRAKSADAFLGLPEDVLTGRYIILAYPNGFSGSFVGNGVYDMPSEFAVVAAEDSTVVNVIPPGTLTINGRPAAPFAIALNRGDVFFGQADVLPFQEQDVSGTHIDANRPVSVFAGVKRTSIPTRVGNFRDHLCEQLPPLDAWGRTGLFTPHYKVTPASGDTAVVRMIAAFTGTDVAVTSSTGVQNFTIGPGVSIELPLLEPMSVVASQPIMTAQYEHSVNTGNPGGGGFNDLGDPFMMLVVPAEQFDTAYAFIGIQNPEFNDQQHYINVVIPPEGLASLKLDGQPVGAGQFKSIPGSRYVYAQIRIQPIAHYIRSDSAFGLYVYGFGQANSYGYPGGMLFRKLVRDFEPPGLLTNWLCGDLTGFTFDSRITDTGIDSCYATPDTQNVVVSIDPFKSGDDTVRFRARLIDPYRDGVVAIRGIDGAGRSRTQTISIPGFTLRFAGSTAAPALLDTFVALNATDFCRRIEITNYGRFEQRITGVALSDSFKRRVEPSQFPITIPPGGSAFIEMCFEGVSDTLFSTILTVVGDCGSRKIADVPVDSRIDTTAPTVGIEGSPCSDEFLLTYYERFRASGIASVDVDSTVNCTAEKLIDPTKLPAQLVQVRLRRTDPRQDMIYQITLRDAVGNALVDRDTIGGFTVDAWGPDTAKVGLRYDHEWMPSDSLAVNGHACDNLTITNYGVRAVNIDHVIIRGNILFSVPPSQLPLVIPPGGARSLMICIEGLSDYDIVDTLLLMDGCWHVEAIALKTPLRALGGMGSDVCGTVIGFSNYAPTKRAFLTVPQPNPVASEARVDIGLPRGADVSIDVYSAAGRPVLRVLDVRQLKAGITTVAFDVSHLDAGAYICRMTTSDGGVHIAKMIVQR